ncbi:hypothetical protein [Neorhizobium sp. S3-V5DH]|uniref:hypothetical protein n=1 Tax=Neorhizobium sp. S3-V5DH TaxID=2485166 RepID=UPI0010430777|nr:hypothetical protein [Neorhizobium sp. S3-V5DH]TCV66277.1 hypothetical protein EDE09_11627 [Neorhizobium sp. S3-V5DH]
MFDLAQFETFDFEQVSDLEIIHPVTGQPTGLVVGVRSYRSEAVKRVQRRLGNAAMLANKRNPRKAGTIEEVEEKTTEIVAASVAHWNMTNGGQPVPATPESVMKILSDPRYFFIAEQIDARADEDARFMTPSPKN